MFDFGSLAGILGGAGTGILGSIIGGNSADRAAREAREAQRDTERKNAGTQFGILNALLNGNIGVGGASTGANFQDEIARLSAMVDNESLPIGQRKEAYKQRLKWLERQRTSGTLPFETSGLPGLREQIGAEESGRMAEFDRVFGPGSALRGNLERTLGGTRGYADALLQTASEYGPAARAAANTAVDRQVSSGLADINKSYAARGLRRNAGGSTGQDQAELALRGNAAGGLAQALADIEANSTSMRSAAMRDRLDLERGIAGQLSGFDVGAAGQRFGLGTDFSNRRLGTYDDALRLLSGIGSPGALVAQPPPPGGNFTGQNIGNALSGIGGQLTGFGLAGALKELFGKAA